MENATKALLIAAEVLIALMIISLAIYLVTGAKSLPEAYGNNMSAQEISKFNLEFTKYIKQEDGIGEYVTPQDVISIMKLKKEYEEKGIEIDVKVDNKSDELNESEFLKENLPDSTGNYVKYIIEDIDYNSQNGKIEKIELKKKI